MLTTSQINQLFKTDTLGSATIKWFKEEGSPDIETEIDIPIQIRNAEDGLDYIKHFILLDPLHAWNTAKIEPFTLISNETIPETLIHPR